MEKDYLMENEDQKLEWHVERRVVDNLIPWSKNPREVTKKQAKELQDSLDKFNLVEIPAVDVDGRIVGGHQRCRILQLLGRGEEEIDVRVPNRKLTKEEFEELAIRLNKNQGQWDKDALASYFDIQMLEQVGFNSNDLNLNVDKMPMLTPSAGEQSEEEKGELRSQKYTTCPNCGEEFDLD